MKAKYGILPGKIRSGMTFSSLERLISRNRKSVNE